MNSINTVKRYFCIALFLLSSLWAAIIISLESGTSVMKYDAYNAGNTNWSDETSYYITIREIRDYVLPQNVRSYNEMPPEKLGYGVYGPTTYIPYVLASFFTGTSSHNYVVYCNLILILLANIFFIALVHISNSQLLLLTAILSIFLPYQRYVWSGMTEGSNCAMSIIMIACGLYLFGTEEKSRLKENVIIGISVFLPVFFGTIRGYQFLFILIPLVYAFSKTKGRRRLVISVSTILCFLIGLFVYVFVLNKYCSPYYSSDDSLEATVQFRYYIQSIFKGDFKPFISEILFRNREAFELVVRQINKENWHWIPAVGPLIISLFLIIGLFFDKSMKEKKALIISYIVISLSLIEAIIVMGRFVHIYRYALGIWACGFYLLCSVSDRVLGKVLSGAGLITLALLVILAVNVYGTKYKFPQSSNKVVYNEEELRNTFAELLPRDTDNPWNNTIASGGSVNYLRFLYPSHIANSTCKPSKLLQLIETDSVKSKYISVIEKNKTQDIIDLCDEKYELIYHDYELRLYKVR